MSNDAVVLVKTDEGTWFVAGGSVVWDDGSGPVPMAAGPSLALYYLANFLIGAAFVMVEGCGAGQVAGAIAATGLAALNSNYTNALADMEFLANCAIAGMEPTYE
jgi:hypothetical protein